MAKVVRTVAMVVGAAALIVATGGAAAGLAIFGTTAGVAVAGVSLGTLMTIAAVSSAVGSIFAKKPGGLGNSNKERLYATIVPDTPRKQVFGRTAMATDVRYHEYNGAEQEYYWQVIALASHAVEAIEELWLDEKLAWTVGGGVTGAFSGYLTVTPVLEGSSANITSISTNWNTAANRRLTGIAHIDIRYKTTGNSKKTQSPFASSIPGRVTVVGKGRKVYDPRRDTTAGGSGAHRASDQTTWQYADGGTTLGNNCALVLLNYLIGWKIAGKLAVGRGLPASRIDLASFITAANVCDEAVTLSAGGTERRYRWDGVISEGDGGDAVIAELLASMDAELTDDGGRLHLRCRVNDLGSPVIADLSADDVVSAFEWQPKIPINEYRNIVRGQYIDASNNSLYQQVDFPAISIASPDGIDRMESLEFAGVQSASQAQRLAKQWLQRLIYSGTFTAEFKARAWGLRIGDPVKFTSFAPLGAAFDNKLFRVIERSNPMNGRVRLKLREENAAMYAWAAEDVAPVTASAPIVYDWMNDPARVDIAASVAGTDAVVSRLSSSTGKVLTTMTDENGRTLLKLADVGEARDGDVVSFASTLPAVPKIVFGPGGNSGTAGQNIKIIAEGLSSTGFTMRAKSQSVTPGSLVTDTGATTGSGGEPALVMNRTNGTAPFDGKFTFAYSVTVGPVGGEPGTISVGIYVKQSGVWVERAVANHSATGSYSIVITPGTVDFGAGNEFGIGTIYAEGTGTAISAFTSVKYTPGTVTETSLTPTGASAIPWQAYLP